MIQKHCVSFHLLNKFSRVNIDFAVRVNENFVDKKKLTVPQKWLSECDSFFVLINNRCMFELAIVYICVTIKTNVFLFHCKIYLYIFFALFMDLSPLTHLCRCMRRQSRIRVTNISRYVSTQVSNKLYTFVL